MQIFGEQSLGINIKMDIKEIISQLYNLKLEEIKSLKSEDFEKLKLVVEDLLKISMVLNKEKKLF